MHYRAPAGIISFISLQHIEGVRLIRLITARGR